jgi:hypothetical protein
MPLALGAATSLVIALSLCGRFTSTRDGTGVN